MTTFQKIKECPSIPEEDKKAALADLFKMKMNKKYAKKVEFGEDSRLAEKQGRDVSSLFIFDETDLGREFWWRITVKL